MHVAFYIRSVQSARGAEQVSVKVARGLAERGHAVDFLVEDGTGWLLEQLAQAGAGVRIINLRASPPSRLSHRLAQAAAVAKAIVATPLRATAADGDYLRPLLRLVRKDDPVVLALRRYIESERPEAVISFLNYPNIVLMLAAQLCRRRPRFVVNVRNTMSVAAERSQSKWVSSVPQLMRRFFRLADAVVAPSIGVAEDVVRITRLPRDRVHVIYNPVFRPEIAVLAREAADHPWLTAGAPPVVLGVGKLKPQKDFETLLRAFKRLRQTREAKLIILGEGPERAALTALAADLGIGDDVDLRGQVKNPFPYYAGASVFVLSSRWEGLPNVLIEALACGCPVVSTDCPSGPQEILARGELGPLVPVGADAALAAAIEATLLAPPPAEKLVEFARRFSYERAIGEYEAVLAGR